MDWVYDILRTWGHILVGLGALAIYGLCAYQFIQWVKVIQAEINTIRRGR